MTEIANSTNKLTVQELERVFEHAARTNVKLKGVFLGVKNEMARMKADGAAPEKVHAYVEDFFSKMGRPERRAVQRYFRKLPK